MGGSGASCASILRDVEIHDLDWMLWAGYHNKGFHPIKINVCVERISLVITQNWSIVIKNMDLAYKSSVIAVVLLGKRGGTPIL